MDINRDGMVSLAEFMGYADKEEFSEQEDWKPVVDEPLFSDEEMQKFEDDYEDYYDYVYDDHGNIVDIKTKWVVHVCVCLLVLSLWTSLHGRQRGVTAEPADAKPPQPDEENQSLPNEQGQPPESPADSIPNPVTPQIDDPKAVHIDGKRTIMDGWFLECIKSWVSISHPGVNPEQLMDKKGDEEVPVHQEKQAEPGQL